MPPSLLKFASEKRPGHYPTLCNIVLVDSTSFDKLRRLQHGVMARDIPRSDHHKQSYLMNELESLGLTKIRLNEFNDAKELGGLVKIIKESLLKEYHNCYPVATA